MPDPHIQTCFSTGGRFLATETLGNNLSRSTTATATVNTLLPLLHVYITAHDVYTYIHYVAHVRLYTLCAYTKLCEIIHQEEMELPHVNVPKKTPFPQNETTWANTVKNTLICSIVQVV